MAIWRLKKAKCRLPGGFTLVEMLASVTILSMLALMGVPYAQSSKDREMEMTLRDTLTQMRWAINAFAWNEDLIDEDNDGIFGEDPAGDPDGDGITDDDRDGSIDEDGPPNYPLQLKELVRYGYIAGVPRDPMSRDPSSVPEETWTTFTVTRTFVFGDSVLQTSTTTSGIFDLRSKAFGTGLNGTRYDSW
jgi:general secretion pathway protein G